MENIFYFVDVLIEIIVEKWIICAAEIGFNFRFSRGAQTIAENFSYGGWTFAHLLANCRI